jgi:hypothetical protein
LPILTCVSEITESFQQKCNDSCQKKDPDIIVAEEKMALEDIISRWLKNLDQPESEETPSLSTTDRAGSIHDEIKESTDDDDEFDNDWQNTESNTYRELVTRNSAYEWLLATLQGELLLKAAENDVKDDIKRQIMRSLPSSDIISRKKCPLSNKMTFILYWDPLGFLKNQKYDRESAFAIESALTVTGDAYNAQAVTCGQYLRQTWPTNGEHTLALIKDLVLVKNDHRVVSKFPRSRSFFSSSSYTHRTIHQS